MAGEEMRPARLRPLGFAGVFTALGIALLVATGVIG